MLSCAVITAIIVAFFIAAWISDHVRLGGHPPAAPDDDYEDAGDGDA